MSMTPLVLASQLAAHGAPPVLSSAAYDVFHAADVLTAVSYLAIATTLLVIVVRLREALPFRIVFILFGAFIVLCGATHIMGTLPLGAQRGLVETSTMVATAAVSLLTAVLLPFFVPRIEALVRDAQLAREREREKARADALAESNEQLVAQAAALNVANDQLAASLRERERLEGHLRQVQKMELMGRLASGVAHDFNNLLTVIQANVFLVRDAIPDTASASSNVDEIDQAAQHATDLTRRLLAFSRKAPSRTERTTLDALLAREHRLLQRALHSDMRLDVRVRHADGFVQIDVQQVQQAILNLIINARDATASAGHRTGTVTVETGQVTIDAAAPATSPPIGPGTYMTLSVRDEGTGMSDDVRAQMFEPFFTTKDEGQGTGLGLSMIYDVMLQSGGGVQVESRLGQGSTFTLLLPRVA
jgi:signal transduction histidine kinase